MKKIFLSILITVATTGSAVAGLGLVKVTDVTIRSQDSLLLAKVEAHSSKPSCVTWAHTFGKAYDGSEIVKAFYSMLLSAQASGQPIRIAGTGSCLAGTGTEEIREINIGPWGN